MAVLEVYPKARVAVAWCELLLDDGEHPTSIEMMRDAGLGPIEVLTAIRGFIIDEIALGSPGKNSEALTQTYELEFMTYLSAKLGML